MLADETEKYWCVNIFFIGLKPHFLAFLPIRQKKKNFNKNYLKTVIFSGILTGCIDESINMNLRHCLLATPHLLCKGFL